jgi:hypothetical protein
VIATDPDEKARIREWRLRAQGFIEVGGKLRPMPARDDGAIISERQSYGRWHRGTGLQIKARGDEEAWLVHLAYALRWTDAAVGSVDHPERLTHWASPEYRESILALIVANAGGYVGLAGGLVPQEVDPDLRRELLGPDVEDLVLGYAERGGEWVPGYAGLLEVEAEAFRYSLELRSEECHQPDREHRGGLRCLTEIRDMVDRRRGRRHLPLAIETVENRLSAARGRLRRWAAEVRSQELP